MPATRLPIKLPLALSPERASEYERTAIAVRDDTIQQYMRYLRPGVMQRTFDVKKWKMLKAKDHLEVYASRERSRTSSFHRGGGSAKPVPEAKLCCVGTVMGSLDDAMYGIVTPTETSMVMRSMATQDQLAEHRVVHDIKLPTEHKPFSYVGLKWTSRAAFLATIVKPRDMVFVEASGFCQALHDGREERIGYMVCHSVEMPELPPLTSQGFLRAKFSLCVLFRESGAGAVEVFATAMSDPAGGIPRKLTSLLVTSLLLAISKVTESAMKKKLVWMQSASSTLPAWTTQRESFFRTVSSACMQCSRELSSRSSLKTCRICNTAVCSRCITTRKLVLGRTKAELTYKPVDMCKGCISAARRMDNAVSIAAYDFVQPTHFGRTHHHASMSSVQSNASTENSLECSRGPLSDLDFDCDAILASCDEDDDESVDEEIYTAGSNERVEAVAEERARFWTQISELHLKAETTYRMAKQQTMAVQKSC